MEALSTSTSSDLNLSAADDTVALSVLGCGGCAFQVKGTFDGTITFEGTVDNGLWATLLVLELGLTASATTTTDAGVFLACCAGLSQVRARMSTYSSGYATVMIRAVQSAPSMPALS